jgi:hypothetical protein
VRPFFLQEGVVIAEKEEKLPLEAEVVEAFRTGLHRDGLDNWLRRCDCGWASACGSPH